METSETRKCDHGFRYDEVCPECGGDCSSANPPVFGCPMKSDRLDEYMIKIPETDPVMVAWNEYKNSKEYASSFSWAAMIQHREGSMWAAFYHGFHAGGTTCLSLEREVKALEHDIEVQNQQLSECWIKSKAIANKLKAFGTGSESVPPELHDVPYVAMQKIADWIDSDR